MMISAAEKANNLLVELSRSEGAALETAAIILLSGLILSKPIRKTEIRESQAKGVVAAAAF